MFICRLFLLLIKIVKITYLISRPLQVPLHVLIGHNIDGNMCFKLIFLDTAACREHVLKIQMTIL